ncbi:MAG: HlyD family efflux transporter periplasmic adaptor subunit, partial [Planctomycetota bacterium]
FTGANLLLLWATLIVLKITHEFGHAYACKHFGGHVPEMGVFLILFTPCAYVDATASWGFPRKRDRIIVCLAGMYVELAIAALAMVLWAITPPGLLRSVLHNVVVLSSIVTLAFNLNPLMRYDGYYVVSDLVEVPNLRQKAYAHCTRVLKRLTLRIDDGVVPVGRGHRAFLLFFGMCSAIYKVMIVLAISVLIASKVLAVGVLIGASYLISEVVKIFRCVVPFLFISAEVSKVRARAAFLGLVLIVGLPFAVMAIPVPSQILAPGVIARESERILRSDAAGFLEAVPVAHGFEVEPGQVVAVLRNPEAEVLIRNIEATLEAANVLYELHRLADAGEAKKEIERLRHLERERDFRVQQFENLSVHSDVEGIVVDCVPSDDLGRYVRRGEPLVTIASGRPVVRALLTAEDLASATPAAGQAVEFRTQDAPGRVVRGTIQRIAAAGTRDPDETFREHLEMAHFSIHPGTGLTTRHLFEIEVTLDESPDSQLRRGMTGYLRLVGVSEPVGKTLLRKALIFVGRVSD